MSFDTAACTAWLGAKVTIINAEVALPTRLPRRGPSRDDGVTTAASRETVSCRTAACQPPGVIQELRWPHGGHGDCASARAGYGACVAASVARRPAPARGRGRAGAGARGGGAICCVAAPAEALSHWDDRLADTRTDRRDTHPADFRLFRLCGRVRRGR